MAILVALPGPMKKCNERAVAGGLEGTYKAWLSDSSYSPDQNFENSNDLPYIRADGVEIASNWEDLVDSNLAAEINVNEFGSKQVTWISLRLGGDTSCKSWTEDTSDSMANLGHGSFSKTASKDVGWTKPMQSTGCGNAIRLYCFQQ